jgi:hypothetical protein
MDLGDFGCEDGSVDGWNAFRIVLNGVVCF